MRRLNTAPKLWENMKATWIHVFKTVALELKLLNFNAVAVASIGINEFLEMRLIILHADVARVSFKSKVTKNPSKFPIAKKSVSKKSFAFIEDGSAMFR